MLVGWRVHHDAYFRTMNCYFGALATALDLESRSTTTFVVPPSLKIAGPTRTHRHSQRTPHTGQTSRTHTAEKQRTEPSGPERLATHIAASTSGPPPQEHHRPGFAPFLPAPFHRATNGPLATGVLPTLPELAPTLQSALPPSTSRRACMSTRSARGLID